MRSGEPTKDVDNDLSVKILNADRILGAYATSSTWRENRVSFISHHGTRIILICAAYIVFAALISTERLNWDEKGQISQPYEMLGGDYTVGYLKEGDYGNALSTAIKAYFLYWQYRPMFAPIIADDHKVLFSREEKKFGYKKPERVKSGDRDAFRKYSERLVVPEPDRFYSHGAGKPLLPQILSMPQLGVIASISSGEELLRLQYTHKHHPLFILTRFIQLVAGLVTILLVYHILKMEFNEDVATLASAVLAFFPVAIEYFPDIHNDSIMLPFIVGSSYLMIKGKWMKAGIVYGLALASKNTAIFVIPALVLFFIWKGYELYRESGFKSAASYLGKRSRELIMMFGIAVLFLLPFANPVSYFSEILTPLTHREYDPRGEDVSKFTVTGRLGISTGEDEVSGISKAINGMAGILEIRGFNSVFIYPAILGLFACAALARKDVSRFSLVMLLMMFPVGLVFQYAIMTYRSLIYMPFFAMLCAEVLTRRQLVLLTWITFFAAVIWTAHSFTGAWLDPFAPSHG